MTLTITFTIEELPGLRKVLNRAMNTWDSHDQPGWLQDLSDLVDKKLASAPDPSPSRFGSKGLQALILDQIRAQQRAGGLLYQGVEP